MSLSQAFYASLGAEAVAASTAYVLIDVSDTSTYPNPLVSGDKTQHINLLSLSIDAETHSTGVYDVWVGVVYELDATNGSAQWFHVWHLETDTNATDSAGRFADQVVYTAGNPQGLNCRVNTAGDGLEYQASNQEQAGNTNWQTDTTLTAASGTAVAPGAGDVVVWVEEVSGTGTLDFNLTALYRKG
jgi:hypothetical protein